MHTCLAVWLCLHDIYRFYEAYWNLEALMMSLYSVEREAKAKDGVFS